ncbi:CrcB protein [Nocardioides daedukensis]|uniref:Fluoride-specific ion channel FluC n=1 Tax=Nocardioides daedukensis TaxID=634462 RepID=A0A7Y9S366_9ACTN|nr:CrcB family protein [Nocardioides daedukensis]NYG59702.1 CrcB protein [Nocardioides daedukensis]
MTPLLVALGAFFGAPARYYVAHHLDRLEAERSWPTGTLTVNVLGSFLLGWITSMSLSGDQAALLGVGFCGAFTTYSSFAVQAFGLGRRRGTAYSVLTVVACLAACALGFVTPPH